jgi:protein SCO1
MLKLLCSLFFCCSSSLQILAEQRVNKIPRELRDVDIFEKRGDRIDLDLEFYDEKGVKHPLKDYFKEKKPVVLMLGYYECPRLCNLLFNGFALSTKSLEWSIGKEFTVVTVSIDTREKPKLAAEKKHAYTKLYGRRSAQGGWHFLTGEQKEITALTRQVGYRYKYHKKIDQFAHAAVLMFLTPDGQISRYLYGIDFKYNDLKLALLEASEGKIGSALEKVLLFCFEYDPDSQSYSFMLMRVMGFAGFITVLCLFLYLWFFWRKEFKKIA